MLSTKTKIAQSLRKVILQFRISDSPKTSQPGLESPSGSLLRRSPISIRIGGEGVQFWLLVISGENSIPKRSPRKEPGPIRSWSFILLKSETEVKVALTDLVLRDEGLDGGIQL